MLFNFFLRAKRSAWIRINRAYAGLMVKLSGVDAGADTMFTGSPVLQVARFSHIRIGDKGSFISRSWATALGVNHPVVLRTLAEGACIDVGDRVGMSGGTICAARSVKIGNDCLFGANVTIVDTDFHHISPALRHDAVSCHADAQPVQIGDNVFVGTGAMILKGVTIGDNSVIGAGSVVCKDIPANVIAAGNPCKVIRSLDESEGLK